MGWLRRLHQRAYTSMIDRCAYTVMIDRCESDDESESDQKVSHHCRVRTAQRRFLLALCCGGVPRLGGVALNLVYDLQRHIADLILGLAVEQAATLAALRPQGSHTVGLGQAPPSGRLRAGVYTAQYAL
jgi:hypothetical protein